MSVDAYVVSHGSQVYIHLGTLSTNFNFGNSRDRGGQEVARFIGMFLGEARLEIMRADDIPNGYTECKQVDEMLG